jgi:hypothetical protein
MSQAIRPNTTSRRALLAGAPAVAALACGAVAAAAADAELLALKAEFDPLFDLWRAMTIEQNAGLEEFEALLHERTGMTRREGWALEEGSPEEKAFRRALHDLAEERAHDPDGPDPASQAWEPVRDRFDELAGEILAHVATTREGLALQARAFASSYSEVWENAYDGATESATWNFLTSVCAFAGVPFPPVKL